MRGVKKRTGRPELQGPIATMSHDEFWGRVEEFSQMRRDQIGTGSDGHGKYGRLRHNG